MATYFIHPNDLKQTSYVDENVDDKLITPAISLAQDLYILPMIGSGVYDELKTQINANTLTALNTTLLTYIKPIMIFQTLYELTEPLTYKLTNKSIVKKKSENSENVDFKELMALKDKFKNIAQWYTERMRRYLVQNQLSYPLYMNPGTNVDTIHPNKQSYNCGWFLGHDFSYIPDYIKAEYPGTYGTE